MNAVIEMAKAHLQNVESKIKELESQKNLVQDQINQLKNYLIEANKNLQDEVVRMSESVNSQQG